MINQYSFGSNPIVLAKKSIIAYFIPLGIWFIVWIAILSISALIGLLFIAVGIIIVMQIKSYVLFVDEEGVWVLSGIFPWNKGIYGVKWCDFGEATYFLNPVSWILNSYTIKISNKYKQENEIVLKNMHNGHIAVSLINKIYLNITGRT